MSPLSNTLPDISARRIASAANEPLVTSGKRRPADILHLREADNTVRWRPGERLQHLFEHRCDGFTLSGDSRHLAVESDEASLAYVELDGQANQLARCLKQHGVVAGDVVALLFDKTVHSYVAMLAVLKLHAAYVPLDGGFPADRIGFIVGDAGARLVLTTASYRALLQGCGAALFCVDEAGVQIAGESAARLSVDEAGPVTSELCYIIYTSGSTGRPKGVPIEHASICNFVRVAAEVYGYQCSDRVYQGLTLAFDFAVEEIWVPLVVGATLLPNQTGSSLLGRELSNFLRTRKVTALCCVPTLLATVEDDVPDLRLLIVSGEACPSDLVDRWHRPGRTMLNAYGPTETTVTATLAHLRPGEPVTIGQPLPTYSIVILSPEQNEALPFGQIGEIGIAGIGVARGYLNRDEQTRKVFIADFLDIPNNASQRIYRTGDLGRINTNGQIEYLGRIDTQVKIRGYRIELAEIESVVMRLPGVSQAVVSTHEPMPGSIELVAYYTWSDPSSGPCAQEVASELRTLLPNYMVPAFYERLDLMPMLASDKADRKALPKPSGERLNATQRDLVPPGDDAEAQIAKALAGVLNIEQVSVEDHFFDHLGANSLLMARFSAQLRELPGLGPCSMKAIYLYPTVRQLAALLRASGQDQPVQRRQVRAHEASNLQYAVCGALQLLLGFAYLLFNSVLLYEGTAWVLAAPQLLLAYGRAIAFGTLFFALTASLPVALKWLLIGRWTETVIPIWSLAYIRFWVVRQLVQANPMVLFVGSPLYIAYLKCLGAKISWQAAVFSTHVPVCTDLISIGAGAIVTKTAYLTSYRADANRIHTGRITIGRDTYVGEASVLDIGTVMEDGSQLGHASSLQRGQRLSAGRRYHGSPAQETNTSFEQLERGQVSTARRIGYTAWQLASLTLVYLPLPILLGYFMFSTHANGPNWADALAASAVPDDALGIAAGAALLYGLGVIGGLVMMLVVPRVLNLALKPDTVYPLYGFHYVILRSLSVFSNAKFYNELFGDSSYVVHYLRALGYKFRGIVQTGSNFGMAQHHDSPFLCEIGKGTMVSDGLTMANADLSNASFRLSQVAIPANSFLGNSILMPAHAKLGPDCLLGTKVAVPIDGAMRAGVGLLGSPCFEIPRSVQRDRQFDHYRQDHVRLPRLRQKNVSNVITMTLLLLAQCVAFMASALFWSYTDFEIDRYGGLSLAVLASINLAFITLYFVLVDRLSLGFRPLQPQHCSIYDDYFWHHERHWKLGLSGDKVLLRMLNGTPFKGLVWRLLGVRVGKKLFDDGSSIVEKTLVAIGDNCCLNDKSLIQSHSLEDGTFKSDRILIHGGCTVGTATLVHYGVELEHDVCIEPDSFLMKGERPAAHSRWCGNPARELRETQVKQVEGVQS